MPRNQVKEVIILILVVILSTVIVYAEILPKIAQPQKKEVEIYKGGRRYYPGQVEEKQASNIEETANLETGALPQFNQEYIDIYKYLNKEEIEMMEKEINSLTQQANYEGNIEELLANFTTNYTQP